MVAACFAPPTATGVGGEGAVVPPGIILLPHYSVLTLERHVLPCSSFAMPACSCTCATVWVPMCSVVLSEHSFAPCPCGDVLPCIRIAPPQCSNALPNSPATQQWNCAVHVPNTKQCCTMFCDVLRHPSSLQCSPPAVVCGCAHRTACRRCEAASQNMPSLQGSQGGAHRGHSGPGQCKPSVPPQTWQVQTCARGATLLLQWCHSGCQQRAPMTVDTGPSPPNGTRLDCPEPPLRVAVLPCWRWYTASWHCHMLLTLAMVHSLMALPYVAHVGNGTQPHGTAICCSRWQWYTASWHCHMLLTLAMVHSLMALPYVAHVGNGTQPHGWPMGRKKANRCTPSKAWGRRPKKQQQKVP